jgi:hypothetical protein
LQQRLRHTVDRDHGAPLHRFGLASACQHTCGVQPVQL